MGRKRRGEDEEEGVVGGDGREVAKNKRGRRREEGKERVR